MLGLYTGMEEWDDEDYGWPQILFYLKRWPAKLGKHYPFVTKQNTIRHFEGVIHILPNNKRRFIKSSGKEVPLDCYFKAYPKDCLYWSVYDLEEGDAINLSAAIKNRFSKYDCDAEFDHLTASLQVDEICKDLSRGEIHPSAASIRGSNLQEFFINAV